jgi:tetratricopeptide (TPR) repeat protein
MIRRIQRSLCVLFLLCLPAPHLHCQDYRSELRLGLSAYQSQSFQVAAEHLEKAVRLDPTSIEAHLYLGPAYNEIYCPTWDFDVESAAAANDRWRLLVMEQYLSVLQLDPANTDALHVSFV